MNKFLQQYRHVIWDWNGTLVDDVNYSIGVINKLLAARGMNPVDQEYYREIFGFPIRDYYARLGFVYDQETFEDVADEFMGYYNQDSFENMVLHDDVPEVLAVIAAQNITQHVLSATRVTELVKVIRQLNLECYFDSITGLTDNYAESKVESGKAMMARLKLPPELTVMIGDTLHDYEVASELGCDCILVSRGHQSHERLKQLNVPVVKTLKDLILF